MSGNGEQLSRLDDLMNPVDPDKPDSELGQWRLRSRWCAVADMIGAAASISLYAVAGIDSVASWPSNQVLLSDPDLVRLATVLFVPPFLWLIVSAGMLPDRLRYWRLSLLPAWSRACFAAAVVVCAAVILGGFEVGAAKGAARVLPGPRYQVSVIGNSPAGWTTVPLRQFRYWQASFVREDGLFVFFGLLVGTAFIALLRLRRAPHVLD